MVSEKDRDVRNRHPKLRLFIINSSRNSFCWEIEMGEIELFKRIIILNTYLRLIATSSINKSDLAAQNASIIKYSKTQRVQMKMDFLRIQLFINHC